MSSTIELELNVPTVDLTNTPESQIVEQIARACEEYGFFQVCHHSISTELIEEYLGQCRLYFALPLNIKQQWKRNEGNSRGWFNDELTKQKRDWKEALDLGVPGTRDWSVQDNQPENKCLDGWNQLPSPEILPNFRPLVTKYFDECAKLADRIAILMAKGLGQDENSPLIRELRENHSSYLRSNFYPLCNELDEEGSKPMGISPHRDAGFLTVLLHDFDCHSLQVLKDERWVTIHPEPYAFTINTGDMAEVWSNGRYKAPLHRVLSHETSERYSTPFFYNPNYETRIEPLAVAATCRNNDDDETGSAAPPIYSPVLWGYFRAVRFAGDLTDLGVEIQVADFLRTNPSPHVVKQEVFAKEADFRVPFSVEKYRPLLQEDSNQTTMDSPAIKAQMSTSSTKKKGEVGGSWAISSSVTLLAICSILALCVPMVESSTRSPLTSRNPFNKERTSVSGFGARSMRKTIFPLSSTSSTKGSHKEVAGEIVEEEMDTQEESVYSDWEEEEDPASNKISLQKEHTILVPEQDDDLYGSYITEKDDNRKLHEEDQDITSTDGSQQLWVQRSKEDPSVLWVLVENRNRGDNKTKMTLKLSVSKDTGDWQVERKSPSSGFLKQYPLEGWVPIEGFYGMYRVPSGILWVLVSNTEPIYDSPPLKTSSSSWWKIRRVVNLEIVHLSRSNTLSPIQLREEVRQLKLLRKALKQHDFYYVPQMDFANHKEQHSVQDMTKSLQRYMIEELDHESDTISSSRGWWRAGARQPDPRFFWNEFSVKPLLQRYERSGWISPKRKLVDVLLQNVLPVTSAFVGVQRNITVDADARLVKKGSKEWKRNHRMSYDELLISRRSRYRAGTRFTVRGADATGAVANFVETEQVCLTTTENKEKERCLHSVASHVQIRGSIPLRWASPADVMTYRPRVRIGTDPLAQARALRLHLLEQLSHYALTDASDKSPNVADIVFVNLVDKNSDQGRLGKMFDSVLHAVKDVYGETNSPPKHLESAPEAPLKLNSVQHIWFDFHAEVKQGRWDRLRMLLDEIQPSLMSHGYFFAHAPIHTFGDGEEWAIKRRQNAIVRTNCMDCLDRTNVVQSIFGRYMLFQQLSNEARESFVIATNTTNTYKQLWAKLNSAFRKNSLTLPWQNGEVAHRLLWADNADAISRLYAGTPALKGDFTRTGKRTKRGALDDGMNSLQRYYLNNFLDADRQEGYDLMVGYSNFSNVGEIPLEVEELEYEEDDVDSENITKAQDSTTATVRPSMSLHEAAREKMLWDVMQGTSYQNREDLQSRLEAIGIPKLNPTSCVADLDSSSLDLRWVPGDLQTHLRSQAAESLSSKADEIVPTSAGLKAPYREGGFDPQKALKAIDERSMQFLPWWVEGFEDWLVVDKESDQSAGDAEIFRPQGVQLNMTITNPLLLACVVVVGTKSPSLLAGVTVALLSFVYLPACLHHDMQQKSRLEGLWSKLQRCKKEKHENLDL